MANLARVEIGELAGHPSGYTAQDKTVFEGFAAALPNTRLLRTLIASDFKRTDGPLLAPEHRMTEGGIQGGADLFVAFRDMVNAASTHHEPTTGFYFPYKLAGWMTPGDTEPQPGHRRVAAALAISYMLSHEGIVQVAPKAEAPLEGRPYTLRLVEIADYREADNLITQRYGLVVDAANPPRAIAAQFAAEDEAQRTGQALQWPPFPLIDVLQRPAGL